jgi:uncharacterized cupin superfamily protein
MSNNRIHEVNKLSVVDAIVEPAPIPAEDIVSGTPEASVALLWRNQDGTLFSGVWHCTPGVFWLDHADETVTLIQGRATITPDHGEAIHVSAGETCFFPNGTRALWEVHETVRKAFHNHDPEGRLLGEAS